MRGLNREKVFFLGSGLALCMAALYAASTPELSEVGQHQVIASVPGRIEVALRADMERLGGPNPFAPYSEERRSEIGREAKLGDEGREEQLGDRVVVPIPLPTPIPEQDQREINRETRVPRPYEVPASFRGVHRPSGGQWRVILEDKHTRELRSLLEGDVWPSLKLRIIRITSDSVLLKNSEGKHYLMRGLHGRKSSGRARSRAPGA
jgi:hypothetical protein